MNNSTILNSLRKQARSCHSSRKIIGAALRNGAPAAEKGDSPQRGIHMNTSFREASYSFESMEQLNPDRYGYRVVPPEQASRYTSTQPVPTKTSFDLVGAGTCSTTKGTISTLGDIYEAVNADNPDEVMSTHAEWDYLLDNDLNRKPHLEILKEDPYLSEYEATQRDWQKLTRAGSISNRIEEERGIVYDEGYDVDY